MKSTFDVKTGAPGKWAPQPGKLFTPVTDASAAIVGDYLWVYGGTTADGKADETVQRGEFGTGADAAKLVRFGVRGGADRPARAADEPRRLRRERRALRGRRLRRHDAAGDASTGPIPTSVGDIPEWKHLDASDLPGDAASPAARRSSSGRTRSSSAGRRRTASIAASVRANIAPEAPFFQLGLVGATVPALKIDGEIGQQLGYLNANTHRHRELRDLRDHRLGVRPPRRRSRSGASAARRERELRKPPGLSAVVGAGRLSAERSPSPGSGGPVRTGRPAARPRRRSRRRRSGRPSSRAGAGTSSPTTSGCPTWHMHQSGRSFGSSS